jgi:hypothetical protein
LNQDQRKSACGMSARIKEAGTEGKPARLDAVDGSRRSNPPSRSPSRASRFAGATRLDGVWPQQLPAIPPRGWPGSSHGCPVGGVAMSEGHAAEPPSSQSECVAFVRRLRRSYARFGPCGMTRLTGAAMASTPRFEPTATILVHQFAEAHTAYADVCISLSVARPVANACAFDLQMLNVLANPARRVDPIFRMYIYTARSFS